MFAHKEYQNVFIVEDRSYTKALMANFDSSRDLVLTFDFGVYHEIKRLGGEVHFIDHLLDPNEVEKENKNIYRYFNRWYLDKDGKDLFRYGHLDFGFVFRQEIWNDFTYSIRLYSNLGALFNLSYKKIFVGAKDEVLLKLLALKKIHFDELPADVSFDSAIYFFPMGRWMSEAIRPADLKAKLRNFLYSIIPWILFYFHKFNPFESKRPLIFVQNYHPTRAIVQKLNVEKKTLLCLERFSNYSNWQTYFSERTIPLLALRKNHLTSAQALWENFHKNKVEKLILTDGSDLTDYVLSLFEKRLRDNTKNYLRIIDSVNFYFKHYRPKLEILVSNVGIFNGVVHAYCQQNNILNYLIINGYLGDDFSDEGKHAQLINAYSPMIKKNYYENKSHVLTLGDPRMDTYLHLPQRKINREKTTVTVGPSAFSNIDLNSFSAEEFCFMFDILSVLQEQKNKGRQIDIIIKMRPNGYKKQYVQFVHDYFPSLKVEIIDSVPMLQVLQKTDFYISFYSQTLFEASMLGIPVVYYKKDSMFMHAPFDGESELVTARDRSQLSKTVDDFYSQSERFNTFLDRSVMEKYLGALDGKCLERNIDFIYKLLECSNVDDAFKIIKG